MVQGSMSCVKYLMFVFNFVFVVCGIILIAVGAIVQKQDVTVFLDTKYVTAPTILIVVGVIIFLLAFLGCCGAVKENRCMVTLFGILLFIIFIIEVAGAISAYIYKDDVEVFLKENMKSSIDQNKKDAMTFFNEMQTKWQCCGVDGPSDYTNSTQKKIPDSCCKPGSEPCTVHNSFQEGCFKEMLDLVKSKIKLVGGVAIGIALVELVGCVFAFCLASAIKKEYEGV